MEYEDQINQAMDPKYECLLFDLDDTLYPLTSGISSEVTKNIQEYMIKKLGIKENVPELCVSLYKHYGTTMAGLKAIGYNFEYDDFIVFLMNRTGMKINFSEAKIKPNNGMSVLLGINLEPHSNSIEANMA
ncbi:hypothetical protein J1N35_008570 [Gossypium stocksii]|uniref:Uncharacterized protein n=1 Tax=Gossypium stocksii TaxID=47602 RepID=A0A9D3W935_9ROSI|nr:hypothetical protein J1N35_008570 [Gossypium stocksii]